MRLFEFVSRRQLRSSKNNIRTLVLNVRQVLSLRLRSFWGTIKTINGNSCCDLLWSLWHSCPFSTYPWRKTLTRSWRQHWSSDKKLMSKNGICTGHSDSTCTSTSKPRILCDSNWLVWFPRRVTWTDVSLVDSRRIRYSSEVSSVDLAVLMRIESPKDARPLLFCKNVVLVFFHFDLVFTVSGPSQKPLSTINSPFCVTCWLSRISKLTRNGTFFFSESSWFIVMTSQNVITSLLSQSWDQLNKEITWRKTTCYRKGN